MTDLEKTLKNVQRIVDELPVLAEKFPYIRNDFNMEIFGVADCLTKTECLRDLKVDNPCNSIGCGLGNSALLFDLSNPEYYDKFGNFYYRLFGMLEFPELYTSNINVTSESWHYLFSQYWAYASYPTFDDFIERCKRFIEHAKPIKKFSWETMEIIE